MAILVTNTTGSSITIPDLGDLVLLPGMNDITALVSPEAIKLSKNIKTALEIDKMIEIEIDGAPLVHLDKVIGISFPPPLVEDIRLISTSNEEAIEVEISGEWLCADTEIRVVSPSGVTTNETTFLGTNPANLKKTLATSFNVVNKGVEEDLIIHGINYGRESVFSIPGSASILTYNPPGLDLDLRVGGSDLNFVDQNPNTGSQDVLVYDLEQVVPRITRSLDGLTNGPNFNELKSWFKFYSLNYPLEMVDNVQFIIYNHNRNNIIHCGLASEADLSPGDPRVVTNDGSLSLSCYFRYDEFRGTKGYDILNPNNYLVDNLYIDIKGDTYYRLEINFIEGRIKLYELVSREEKDWYTLYTDAEDILKLPEGYLDQYYFENTDHYAPFIHFAGTTEEAGVLAIRGVLK